MKNDASGALALLSNAGLAPGTLFTVEIGVLGLNLFLTPINTENVSVEVQPTNGSTAPVNVPIVEISQYRLRARLPESFPLGHASIVLIRDGERSNPASVQIRSVSFAIYRKGHEFPGFGGAGEVAVGRGIIQNVSAGYGVTLNSLTNPVLPGEFVTLWGTGLGNATVSDISVLIGDQFVSPTYAGHSTNYLGLDQINFRLPESPLLPTGCYVRLRVRGDSWASNEVTFSIADRPGTCTHPLGLTPAMLAKLDSGGTILFADGAVRSSIDARFPESISLREFAYFDFRFADLGRIDSVSAPLGMGDASQCSTLNYIPIIGFDLPGDADAGESLSLVDPNGRTLTLPWTNGYSYYNIFFPEQTAATFDELKSAFPAGQWLLRSPGGATVRPFQFDFPLPPTIRLTNSSQLRTIDLQKDLSITWEPAGYTDADELLISLSNQVVVPQSFVTQTVGVACRFPALQGKATIPVSILSAVPPTGTTFGPRMNLKTARRNVTPLVFPLTQVDGLDGVAYIHYTQETTLEVRFLQPNQP